MGFLDKAKAAASDLASKADSALSSTAASLSGGEPGAPNPDALLHDLGVIDYLEATGRPAPPEERARVMVGLQEAERRGTLRSLALRTAVPTPPPPPGAAAAAAAPAPPAAAAAAPPPPAAAAPPPAAAPAPEPPPASEAPPPPSWA
ncbi:MAG: hypothetical protein KQH57_02470 [Actinomycetales bacterium]|nr:hypothetical protein [Actinomycetales bacterium]